jgi:glycosyltransferase involved in cell wall biosynthesis
MKLLVVAESLVPRDGWSAYSAGLLRGLLKLGVSAKVLTSRRAPGGGPEGAETVACLSSPLGGLVRPPAIAWNAWHLLRHARRFELLHFMVEPYATASLPVGLPPSVITVHGTYAVSPFSEGLLTRATYAGALQRAKAVVCVSRFTRDALLEKMSLGNLVVIHNGHELLPNGLEGEPDGLPVDGSPVILSVGALKERKGYHVALHAVSRLRERYPDLRYYLVGDDADGKYVRRLRSEIAELGLSDQAIITGSVPEARLRDLYRRADAFLLTPVNAGRSFEGFGIAYLEAGAFGKPVVGSLGCGAAEAIENGVTGFLAPQHDPAAVADRLATLLGNPQLATQLGEAGRQRAEAQTWTAVARRYLDLYEQAARG